MFTGIIRDIGKIKRKRQRPGGMLLGIFTNIDDCAIGDSIAVNGVCLTVERLEAREVIFFVSRETMSSTTIGKLRLGELVNLEPALKVGDKLGGHFVLGHVHTIGKLVMRRREGLNLRVRIKVLSKKPYNLKEKGSIAVDGVSLTIQKFGVNWFEVVLIPETLKRTILSGKPMASLVNIEFAS